MRKIILCLISVVTLVSCSTSTKKLEQPVQKNTCPQMFGVWVSYSELGDMYDSEKGFKKSFESAVKKCKKLGINTMFVHVRANADAFYPSKLFPYSNKLVQPPDYDMLQFMIDTVHSENMEFHAWINPYRVSNTTNDYKQLSKDSPAYKWLSDGDKSNDSFVISTSTGMYLNPACQQVKKLIVEGVREVVDNYDVDGIHFDDYFYLSTNEEIDQYEYVDYLTQVSGQPLTLNNWRRANVTQLVSEVYRITQQNGILFGISPAANLQYNTDKMYADVERWIQEGLLDYIMPQIYFGYEYPDERYTFEAYLKQWKRLAEDCKPALYIGLAAYKSGLDTEKEKEWSENFDIISRQMDQLDKDEDVSGYVLFSYSYLFSSEKCYVNQIKCIEKYLG